MFKLTSIDSSREFVLKYEDVLLLGRGNETGCLDKRVSRKHAEIKCTREKGLTITALHTNPCFLMIKGAPPVIIVKKGETHNLNNEDYMAFLPDTSWFRVEQLNINVTDSDNLNIDACGNSNDIEEADTSNISACLLDQAEPTAKQANINGSAIHSVADASPAPENNLLSRDSNDGLSTSLNNHIEYEEPASPCLLGNVSPNKADGPPVENICKNSQTPISEPASPCLLGNVTPNSSDARPVENIQTPLSENPLKVSKEPMDAVSPKCSGDSRASTPDNIICDEIEPGSTHHKNSIGADDQRSQPTPERCAISERPSLVLPYSPKFVNCENEKGSKIIAPSSSRGMPMNKRRTSSNSKNTPKRIRRPCLYTAGSSSRKRERGPGGGSESNSEESQENESTNEGENENDSCQLPVAMYDIDGDEEMRDDGDPVPTSSGTNDQLTPLSTSTAEPTISTAPEKKIRKLPDWMLAANGEPETKRFAPSSGPDSPASTSTQRNDDVKTEPEEEKPTTVVKKEKVEVDPAPLPSNSTNATPQIPSTTVVKAEPESDANPSPVAAPTAVGQQPVTTRRPLCQYESTCYRRNPQHKADFSHPGDSDWLPVDRRPPCPFGAGCYRRNQAHRVSFNHTARDLARRPIPRPRNDPSSDEEDDEGSGSSYVDPFNTDDSHEDSDWNQSIDSAPSPDMEE